MMSRQIGRARADLQYRLGEAKRALVGAVGQRYADGTSRIRSALDTADGLREASAAEAAARETGLAEREAALRHALGLLDQAAVPGYADPAARVVSPRACRTGDRARRRRSP